MPHYIEDFTINDIPIPDYFKSFVVGPKSNETRKEAKFLNIEVLCLFQDDELMNKIQYIFENYNPNDSNLYSGIMDSETYDLFYRYFNENENMYFLSDGVKYNGVIKVNKNSFKAQPFFNRLENLVYKVEFTLEKDIWQET